MTENYQKYAELWPKEPTADAIINAMMNDDLGPCEWARKNYLQWIEVGKRVAWKMEVKDLKKVIRNYVEYLIKHVAHWMYDTRRFEVVMAIREAEAKLAKDAYKRINEPD